MYAHASQQNDHFVHVMSVLRSAKRRASASVEFSWHLVGEKMSKKWSKGEDTYLALWHGVKSSIDIGKYLGRSPLAISMRAFRLDISKHWVKPSDDYFDTIDSNEKAYILGLLASDGCVYIRDNQYEIALRMKDAKLVSWVRDRLSPGATVLPGYSNMAILRFNSLIMGQQLARYGIVPRKTWSLSFPDISCQYQQPFILGLFDGDGGVCWYRTHSGQLRPKWYLYGRKEILEPIIDIIKSNVGVTLYLSPNRNNGYRLQCSHVPALRVSDWLHQCGLGLTRKTI